MSHNEMSVPWVVPFLLGEAVFLGGFAFIILKTKAQSTPIRVLGVAILGVVTYLMEGLIAQVCLASGRPHWAATTASLLWVQLLSASDLAVAARVDASQLAPDRVSLTSAIALVWNMRRIGTRWQVKNITPAHQQSRARFILGRATATLIAYLFVDFLLSMPPPEAALTESSKATLFSLHRLSTEDIIFRTAMTISYWLSTAVLNLFMTNVGAVGAVLFRFSKPEDCPPLYASFSEAYTVRRFWGVTWHQMFRSFLTGHADLIVDNTLPFVSHHSVISRYTRLAVAFFISGAIHYRADQLMGVPNSENGAIIFFLLHAFFIMVEDTVTPVASAALPVPIRRVLGWAWVLLFFIWTSPTWIYSSTRLGMDSAALLPVRLIGPSVSECFSPN